MTKPIKILTNNIRNNNHSNNHKNNNNKQITMTSNAHNTMTSSKNSLVTVTPLLEKGIFAPKGRYGN